ncbi:MAG: pyruvate ferredoxin oxidoreductase [Desulfohalobiaceae bacterium]|nr:pyruvate ferredoxin oxidoreductase [Desulfohalobiaceae bacterium]
MAEEKTLFKFPKAKRVYEQLGEDRLSNGIIACPGCAEELGLRYVLRTLGQDATLFGIPGCSILMYMGNSQGSYSNVPWFMGAMTNIAAMASGYSRYLQKTKQKGTPIVIAGDGSASDVGFQSLSGAAERGEKIIFICLDNEGYMNTGMQRSSSTPYKSWTSTTPVGEFARGKNKEAKYLPLLMAFHNIAYTATANVGFLQDYVQKLNKAKEAIQHGMAYIHLLCPCDTGWRYPSDKTIDISQKAVDTNYFPLWEAEYGHFRMTYEPKKVLPVKEYISMQGKYRHLKDEDLEEIQEQTDKRYNRIKALAESGEKQAQAKE